MPPMIGRDFSKDDLTGQAIRRQTRLHRLIASAMLAALIVLLLMFMFSERRPPEAPKAQREKTLAAPDPVFAPGIRRLEPGEALEPVLPLTSKTEAPATTTTTSTTSTAPNSTATTTTAKARSTSTMKPVTTTTSPPPTPAILQLGVFSSRATAEQLVSRIEQLEGIQIIEMDKGFKVQAGPFPDMASARKAQNLVKQKLHLQATIKKTVP